VSREKYKFAKTLSGAIYNCGAQHGPAHYRKPDNSQLRTYGKLDLHRL
jgi:hypothetical protein